MPMIRTRSSTRRFFIPFLAFATLMLLVVLGMGSTLSRPAQKSVGLPPAEFAFNTVAIQTPLGQSVSGWFLRGEPGAGVILLLHGIRGSRLDMLGRAQFLAKLGYSVLLIDLPAHGESPARHITFGINEADGVNAALGYLVRQLPGEKIGVIGVSLGAAALVFSTPDVAPHAIVLESMYPTIAEAVIARLRMRVGHAAEPLAPLLLWQLPLRLGISPHQLRPIDILPAVRAPVLIAAGSADQHTTLAETRRLFAAARQPKELWIVEGAAHVNLHAFDRIAYESRIAIFFMKYLRGS